MHKVTRECDEYVCSCGLRWDTDDDDPHKQPMIVEEKTSVKSFTATCVGHKTPEEHIAEMREVLKNANT